ncbi:hypothetical protein F503_03679 [Ophiostoma piceae UAMH 11346]|uniref:Uncharacterized protein n=1 Tax=Ophiostoma piceae (strain UAMH 11346) TaxID=1262450 RepID=S3BV05_OPHP1|nr:hypothetical protein F503_03679 [Ophiostoma piceae UAMH 11346]
MADLLDDDSNGNGIPTSRPQIPIPAPTSSPRAGIRGPKMIMKERQEREARRFEQEQMEKAQAEQDARVMAERRQAAERAAERERAERAAAAVAGSMSKPSGNVSQTIDPATQRRQQRAERTAAVSSGQPIYQQDVQQQQPPPQQPIPPQPQQAQQKHVRLPQGAPQQTTSQIPGYSVPPQISDAQAGLGGIPGASARTGGAQAQGQAGQGGDLGLSGGSRPRNSFPHAFERWEALSAHWEGLTSFWIRQLQQRSEEIDQDPLSRQLARQVTDLSAAGANLFHAVVELQRLRASSERKFQRWFFEMRSDMEHNTEVHGRLEAAIQEERRGREQAIQEALENERSNSKVQKQLAEMRKELAISKDEARRAWEELGRREQEERDRLISLQEGQPTIVGGVQVAHAQGAPQQGSDDTYEEEYGTPSSLSAPGSTYPPSASQQQYYATPSSADYSGQGFAAPWETVPRHHHPTRLSDVIEEDDERSRTSTSQVSRGDRL